MALDKAKHRRVLCHKKYFIAREFCDESGEQRLMGLTISLGRVIVSARLGWRSFDVSVPAGNSGGL